jgi:hypothetical protein
MKGVVLWDCWGSELKGMFPLGTMIRKQLSFWMLEGKQAAWYVRPTLTALRSVPNPSKRLRQL